MEQKLLIFILYAVLSANRVFSANILIMQISPAKSHLQFIKPLAEEIIKRGHNVTLVSGYPLSDQFQSNYTFISLEKAHKSLAFPLQSLVTKSEIQGLMTCFTFAPYILGACDRSSEMKEIFLSKDHYDLIIAEFFFSDSYFALGSKFNAPVVGFSTQSLLPFQNWIIGEELHTSYVPNTFSSSTENMSLISRINNAVVNMFSILYYEFFTLPHYQAQIEEYFHFGKGEAPQIREALKNMSVLLVNAHYSFGYAKPTLPNVVHVAGLHLTTPKPLPKNIRIFMDEAEQGVICLSLGSTISPTWYQSLGKILIRVFENVPQRVIMKWDRKMLPYIPSNVLVQEWLPQSDILSHPNCRLFISHGGLLGLLESLKASVPVIGIPFFADQHHNVAILEHYKIGLALQLEDVPSKLLEKVEEVLKNQIYKENIEKRSRLFRDRLVRPLDEAMYWIDHVIKHKDISHLRPASTQLTWYQLYSLDVILILMVSFFSILYLVKKIFMFLLKVLKNRIFSKATVTEKKNQKMD